MWKKIYFNKQNIEHQTGNSTLIKIPKTNKKFWHPSKLIKNEGGKGYFLSFLYTENWEFKILKTNEIIDSEQIETYFEQSSEQINKNKTNANETFVHVKEPEKINKKVEVLDELLN